MLAQSYSRPEGSVVAVVAVVVAIAAWLAFVYLSLLSGLVDRLRGLPTEEDEAREQAERDRAAARKVTRAGMTEHVRREFALGLYGAWRAARVARQGSGDPAVHADRMVFFRVDGTGTYRWTDQHGVVAESTFEYRTTAGGGIDARLTSPAETEWVPIRIGFDALPDEYGGFTAVASLDSANKLPPEVEPFWPFWGDFLRVAEGT